MFQTENRRLHQELVDSVKEKDRIQKMWLDEREESLKIREILKDLQSEKEFLSVTLANNEYRFSIASWIQSRLRLLMRLMMQKEKLWTIR
jgi:hypothetical protein